MDSVFLPTIIIRHFSDILMFTSTVNNLFNTEYDGSKICPKQYFTLHKTLKKRTIYTKQNMKNFTIFFLFSTSFTVTVYRLLHII